MTLEDLYRLLRSGHVQAQGVVDTMTQPIVVLDSRLCVLTANNAFLKVFAVQRDDVLGQSFFDLGDGQWELDELRKLFSAVIPKASAVVGYEVSHDFPAIGQRTFLLDARRLVHPDDNSSNILVLFDDVTVERRRRAEADLVLSETRHRMKNVLGVIRAIALQTQVEGLTAGEYREAFLGRLDAMARAQDMARKEKTEFAALLRSSFAGIEPDRFSCEGETVEIPASQVVPISLIFHELATNAIKYGALSVPGGKVQVTWRLGQGARRYRYLACEWREEGGPAVTPSGHKGFGTELIKGSAAHIGGQAQLTFDSRGLVAAIELPLGDE